ncbi:MAG: tetratricopeptide repeat protein [Candidatus Aquicultor sp.]|nr:tetratricopeptide repeat protein [Candidatus Aquicultor sp.]
MKDNASVKKYVALGLSVIIIAVASYISYRYVNASNIYAKATHELEEGNLSDAEEGLEKAIRLNPWHADAHYELATVFKKTNKKKDALKYMSRAIALNANNPDYHLGIGFLYFNDIGDKVKAKKHFEQAFILDKTNYSACYMLAVVSEGERDFGKAMYFYKKAINLDPGLTMAYKQLAALYNAKGMEEQAKACWNNVIEIDPDDKDALAYFDND